MAETKQTSQQLTSLLDRFYHNPVAMVSFELFLSIAAIIFFAVFAIRPTLLTMSNLIKEIEDKRQLETQLIQKTAALATAQVNFLAVQDRISLLDQAIPEGAFLGYTLKVIEKTASDYGLTITNMTVLEIPREVSLEVPFAELDRRFMPIQVSLVGNYEGIRSFAEELRNSRRSFVTERINFSTQDSRGQKILEATMLISAPYYGLQEAQ